MKMQVKFAERCNRDENRPQIAPSTSCFKAASGRAFMYSIALNKHDRQISQVCPHRFAAAGSQGTRIIFVTPVHKRRAYA